MIVKNEEETLDRILSPMAAVADQILIADTGSTDRTKEIAGQYTPFVLDFPWCEDFSAARNFLLDKVRTDYWIWLDADDVITPENISQLCALKDTLTPDTDIVMMKYITDFHEDQSPSFLYYRERILKTAAHFRWSGKVHEAISLRGNILYSPIEVEHRKIKPSSPDRNLLIYQHMISAGEVLEPRHEFYYGRELFYHKLYREAIAVFLHFLNSNGAWLENRLDACLQLSYCYHALGQDTDAINTLLYSLQLDVPRAEICCELGSLFLLRASYRQAAYWYQQALNAPCDIQNGGFYFPDCHDFFPLLQLCVCYDRLGEYEKAISCLNRAGKLHPDHPCVLKNRAYFLRNKHRT